MPSRCSRCTLATIAAALGLLASACHGEERAEPAVPTARTGPADVVRVALPELPWPLDAARVEGRDATTVARALLSTPLRTDPATGALRPGLCSAWRSDPSARTWRFRCRNAGAVAAQLRRVARLRASPWHPLFAPIERVSTPDAETLVVRLRFPWRRFPYVLTVPAAAPPELPGPFRVVAASRDRIVAERPGLRVVFLRLEPRLALDAFRRGLVDEAPVPLGRLYATRADPELAGELRVRPLRALDLVDFGDELRDSRDLRLAYWRTAARGDYEALVPEGAAPQAFGLVRTEGAEDRASPSLFRASRRSIRSLPERRVGIEVEADRDDAYRARILWAAWRDLGLRPAVLPRRGPGAPGAARFRRLVAAYPAPEALLAAVLLDGSHSEAARRDLVTALGARDPRPLLARADARLQEDASVIPVAWVADARLVSSRLRGWRRDELGAVDYTRVKAPARSRSR